MLDKQQLQQSIDSEEATPEEQQEYEQAAEVALTALHSGKTAKNTVGRVLNAESTEKGVAEAVFVLLRRTEEQMKGLSDAVKVQVAEDLVDSILDLMIASDRLKESEVTDQMVEEIVKAIYTRYTQDAEERGALDTDKIKQDIEPLMQGQKPQGYAAMSNQEAQTRGLMNV